uniref:Uncharacterized protein n=1 Tax=Prolemur simus TaxID=1328070 RepID=A0A8C8YN34_PROSS
RKCPSNHTLCCLEASMPDSPTPLPLCPPDKPPTSSSHAVPLPFPCLCGRFPSCVFAPSPGTGCSLSRHPMEFHLCHRSSAHCLLESSSREGKTPCMAYGSVGRCQAL